GASGGARTKERTSVVSITPLGHQSPHCAVGARQPKLYDALSEKALRCVVGPQLGMGLLQPPAAGGAGLGLGRVGFPGLLQVVEVDRHAPQGAVRTLLLHEERQHAAETRVAYPAVSASPAAHYLTLPFAPPARRRDRPGITPRPARPPGPPR